MPRDKSASNVPPADAAWLRKEAAPASGPLTIRLGKGRYEWEDMIPEVVLSGDGYAFVRLPAFSGLIALNEPLKTASVVPADEVKEAVGRFKRTPKAVEAPPEVPAEVRAALAAVPAGYRLRLDPATGEPSLVKARAPRAKSISVSETKPKRPRKGG